MLFRSIFHSFLLSAVLLFPLIAFFWTPYALDDINLAIRLNLPTLLHPFGTDFYGRDLFSRLYYGLGITYSLAIASVGSAFIISISISYISAFTAFKKLSLLFKKLIDFAYTLPVYFTALLISAAFNAKFIGLFFAITLLLTGYFYYSFHPLFIKLKNEPYLMHAKSLGVSPIRFLTHHLVTALAPLLWQRVSLAIILSIALETGLSFIGLGVNPPTPTLGSILADHLELLLIYPYQLLIPCFFMILILFSLNYLFGFFFQHYEN